MMTLALGAPSCPGPHLWHCPREDPALEGFLSFSCQRHSPDILYLLVEEAVGGKGVVNFRSACLLWQSIFMTTEPTVPAVDIHLEDRGQQLQWLDEKGGWQSLPCLLRCPGGSSRIDKGYDPVKNLSRIAGVLECLVIDSVSPPELIIGDLLLSEIVQITGLSDEALPLIGPKTHQTQN